MAKAGLILDRLFETMPAFLAEDYDNVGLLAGSREREVHTVLCALDLNLPVLREAAGLGAELIVTHHPILFRGRKNLCEDDPEGKLLAELVRGRFCLMAMHTNFDSADVGVNDALAQSLGLEEVQALSSGMRMGVLSPCDGASLAQRVENALGGVVRRYGDGPAKKSPSWAVPVGIMAALPWKPGRTPLSPAKSATIRPWIFVRRGLPCWKRDMRPRNCPPFRCWRRK